MITSNSAIANAVVIGGSGSPDVAALVDARWTVNGGMSLTMGADVSLSAGAALSVSGTLHLGEHQTVGGTMTCLGPIIDILSGQVLTLFDGAGTVLGREIFAGNFASSNFSLSSDHGTGTMLSFHA